MILGTLDIPDYRINALCAVTARIYLDEMKNNPEVRERVMEIAEEIRAERELKAKGVEK